MTLVFELSLLVLLLFLLCDDAEELIAFGFSLLGHHDLLLDELLATGLVEVYRLFSRQFRLFLLLTTSLALTLFEGPLGPQCVDFPLTVGCALLELSKPLDFQFLLGLDASLLGNLGLFLGDPLGVVSDNLEVFLSLLTLLGHLPVLGDVV